MKSIALSGSGKQPKIHRIRIKPADDIHRRNESRFVAIGIKVAASPEIPAPITAILIRRSPPGLPASDPVYSFEMAAHRPGHRSPGGPGLRGRTVHLHRRHRPCRHHADRLTTRAKDEPNALPSRVTEYPPVHTHGQRVAAHQNRETIEKVPPSNYRRVATDRRRTNDRCASAVGLRYRTMTSIKYTVACRAALTLITTAFAKESKPEELKIDARR